MKSGLVCQAEKFTLSVKLEKCTVFNEFKLEKCTPDFFAFYEQLKNRRRLCGNVGKPKAFPRHCGKCGKVARLFHAFHNDGISTKLLFEGYSLKP
jgi:hypothetical protein